MFQNRYSPPLKQLTIFQVSKKADCHFRKAATIKLLLGFLNGTSVAIKKILNKLFVPHNFSA